jgi:hypothetical protein
MEVLMVKKVISMVAVALFATVVGVALCAHDKKEEKKVTKDQVPASVISAFEKAYPTAMVNEYEQKTVGEKVWYSIEFVDGGITKEVKYGADGTLMESKSDLVAKDLPEAVRSAIDAKYPGAEIVKAETEVRNGIVLYDVKLKVKGEHEKVKFNDKGEIVKKDDD